MPDISSLVKKTDCNTKVTEIENKPNNHNHDKYITTPEFHTLAADVFHARLAPENLVSKVIFDNYVSRLDSKIAANETKKESIENEFKKLKTLDLNYFIGKSHFEEDRGENYLVFQIIKIYFEIIDNTKFISSSKSKGLSAETIKPYATSDNSLTWSIIMIDYYGSKVSVKFNGICLTQSKKLTYSYGTKVNIYIVYELGASASTDGDPTLRNCLFGALTLTKNADFDKYGYSGYGNGFDRRAAFSFPSGGFGENVLIFGVKMSSSAHIDNKKKDILVLGKGPTQGLEHTLSAEKMYSINFTVVRKIFCLSLHYNRANIYLFFNGTEIHKFKAKYSEIVVDPICLRNISKDWSVDLKVMFMILALIMMLLH